MGLARFVHARKSFLTCVDVLGLCACAEGVLIQVSLAVASLQAWEGTITVQLCKPQRTVTFDLLRQNVSLAGRLSTKLADLLS